MLNLQAYFDESGTDAASEVVVVGGYIGPSAAWRELGERLRDILDAEGAPYYHATDAEGGRTPRGPYKGWGIRRARRLTDKIVAAVSSTTELEGLAIHVKKEDWLAAAELAMPYLSTKELLRFPKSPHDMPFQILAKSCIDFVVNRVDPNIAPSETVAFIFEDNDFANAALSGYQALKEIHAKRARFGDISFECKRQSPALQAADLLAWQYRRACILRTSKYPKAKIHRSLRPLVKPSFEFRQLGKAQLCSEVREALKVIFEGRVRL